MEAFAGCLIAGFHRSATSALAKCLADQGVSLGGELMAPHISNPDGHFEDCWLVQINDAILSANGTDWTSTRPATSVQLAPSHLRAIQAYLAHRAQQAHGGHWAAKDPRFGTLLGAWLEHAPTVAAVVPIRHPADCTHSLRQRHALELTLAARIDGDSPAIRFWQEPELAWQMWVAHHEAVLATRERFTALKLRCVPMQQVISHPAAQMPWASSEQSPVSLGKPSQHKMAQATAFGPSWLGASADLRHRITQIGQACCGDDFELTLDSAVPQNEAALFAHIQALLAHLLWSTQATQPSAAPPSAPRPRVEQARKLANQGHWIEAHQLISQVVTDMPQAFIPMVNWAEYALMLGQTDAVQARIKEWLSNQVQHQVWQYHQVASLILRLSSPELSLLFENRLLELSKPNAPEWINLYARYLIRSNQLKGLAAIMSPFQEPDALIPNKLKSAFIEWSLLTGKHDRVWHMYAQALCDRSDLASYTAYLVELFQQLPSGALRQDLMLRVHGHLNTLVAHV